MGAWITALPIAFPILAGLCLLLVKFKDRKHRQMWVFPIITINAIFALFAMHSGMAETFTLVHFTQKLSLTLYIDGLSKVFGTMVSVLWVITTIYAFEYMTHEGREDQFFAFFTITFGVVLGIAFSGNFLTMYLFYEFLTLVTLPLVMHAMDNKARHAGKVYILYMMFGAALAFIGFVFIYCYGTTTNFILGGVLNTVLIAGHEAKLQLVFFVAFLGFGVKAAIFPLYRWLPKASVAPTPVTALLHAVAVVKSGVFAIIRLTYYSFGTDFLRNSTGTKFDVVVDSNYHCVWFCDCFAYTAYQAAFCVFDRVEFIVYFVWDCIDDTCRFGSGIVAYDLSCGIENYIIFYSRCIVI